MLLQLCGPGGVARRYRTGLLFQSLLTGYVNRTNTPGPTFTFFNARPWPVEVAAAMTETEVGDQWVDISKEKYDYRTLLEIPARGSKVWAFDIPITPEPVRLRFLWYRQGTKVQATLHRLLQRANLEASGRVLYPDAHPFYSREFLK